MSLGIGIGVRVNISNVIGNNNSSITPPPISNYAIWYRADGLVTGVTNSYGSADALGNVSQLTDLSNNSRHATQLTGVTQPTLIYNRIGSNNRKAVRSDGLTQVMNMNALSLTNNISAITIFAVTKVNTGGSISYPIYFSNNTPGGSRADIRNEAANIWSAKGRRLDADSADGPSGSASTVAFKIVTAKLDYYAAKAYIYENGALINTDTTFQTSGNTSATNSAIANLFGPSGNTLNGDIGEIIVYTNTMSDANVLSVHTYLNAFYGLY